MFIFSLIALLLSHGCSRSTTEKKGNLQIRGSMVSVQHELVCETRQTIQVLTSKHCQFWSLINQFLRRLALGSFVEEYNNKVQIVSLDEDNSEFTAKSTFDHPYPTTKIMWIPDSVSTVKSNTCMLLKFDFNILERSVSRPACNKRRLFTSVESSWRWNKIGMRFK